MDLKLQKFARDNVELVPDTMELIVAMLGSPSNGLKMEIVFKWRLTNELMTR